MGKYFGTDGFRGEANVVLTVEHAFKVGRYLGWYYGQEHKARIVIGKDTRRSSYMFEYALAAGLTASGADAYLLHVTTTPSVSYVVRTEDFDCGIMISASHNPYYDNGIYVINNEPDGTNINTNCGSTHINVLREYVKENGLDVGFAYDGDADRCIAVDENGNVVDGDLILYVCGKYMKEHGQLKDDTIVTTIMSNLGLYKACDKIGMKYEKTQVGDKYVYENMVKNGFMLGGEQSGHIIFSKHATTGDGILTSLMLMEVIMETKQSLGQLTEEVKIYPQLLKNVRVADKKTARENPEVVKAVDAVAEALGDDGRILVRESGTEPVIRVMVEAATDELCEKYVAQVIDVIEKEGLIVE